MQNRRQRIKTMVRSGGRENATAIEPSTGRKQPAWWWWERYRQAGVR